MTNKKSRPVQAHHGGNGKTINIILPLLHESVKGGELEELSDEYV